MSSQVASPVDSVAPQEPDSIRTRRHFLTPRNAPYLFLVPMVLLYGSFKLYPYISAAWLSLTTNQSGQEVFVGLKNYARLAKDPLFWTALRNTGLILVIQVPLMLTLAMVLAIAFNSKILAGRSLFRVGYFVPIVMGLVAYGILFKSMLSTQFGVVNYLLGMVGIDPIPWLGDPTWARVSIIIAMTWHYTGQSAVIYLAQLQSVPEELYEASAIDGASKWQQFRYVTVPGMRPAIVLTIVLSTIGTLQLFDEPYVLTNGGPDNATITIGMYLYQNGFKYFDFGYASAIGWALTVIILIVSGIQFFLLKEER